MHHSMPNWLLCQQVSTCVEGECVHHCVHGLWSSISEHLIITVCMCACMSVCLRVCVKRAFGVRVFYFIILLSSTYTVAVLKAHSTSMLTSGM